MISILRFRIELQDVTPPIWRRIVVPADSTFWDLHVAIQDAMGWEDKHLHAFRLDSAGQGHVLVGIPDPDGETKVLPGWKAKLRRRFGRPGDRAIYEYDFGDSWRHVVLLEANASGEPGIRYPRCLDGARRCPPEDCGGAPGYEDFLAAIADPDHEAHDEMLAWCGGSYDPEAFNPRSVTFTDPAERLKALLS